MIEALKPTDTVGAVFRVKLSVGANGENWMQTVFDSFTTGTWTLECRRPGGTTWVDTGTTFSATGLKRWAASQHLEYRFSGGDVGAAAVVVAESEGAAVTV